jgi:fatty acid desaturase
MLIVILKAGCVAIFALALAGLAGLLPVGLSGTMQNIAVWVLVVHVLELVIMFKHVRLYRGPLAISVALTLLFGLLHWKPLADEKAREARRTRT